MAFTPFNLAQRLGIRATSTQQGLFALVVTGLHSLSLFWMMSLLARYCPPSSVGHYVFGYAVAAPLFMFLGFRLRIVLANDTGGVGHTWGFVRFRVITSLFALLLVAGGALVLMGATTAAAIIALIAAAKAAEAVSDICHGGFQRLQMMPLVLRSVLLRSLSTLLAISIVIPITRSVTTGAITVLLCWTLQLLLDLRRLRQHCPANPALALTLDSIWSTARRFSSLGITALLASVAFNVPRYFIAVCSPADDLGYYGVIAYFGLMIGMVAIAATEAIVPGITRQHLLDLRNGDYLAAVRHIYALIVGFGLASIALSLLGGELALRLLFGADYTQHLDAFIIIQVAGTFAALAFCQAHIVIALGLFRQQLKAALFAFAVLLSASAVLVPRWSILGAAFADLVYALIYFALIEWIVVRASRVKGVS